MGTALKFRQINVPRQQGEQARLKVVQGPDYGTIYVIVAGKASIGRGDENDIMISDLKASRTHASVIMGSGGWIIRDAGSSNGILYNGQPAREAKLKLGDTFTLGETTLEFITAEAGTTMLVAPPRDVAQVKAEQAAFAAQKQRVRAMSGLLGAGAAGANGVSGMGKTATRKFLMFGIVAALAWYVSNDTPVKPKAPAKKDADAARDLASYLPSADPNVNKAAETLFKEGFREYRERNYIRARIQFETVLQITPGHPLANLYLQKCNKEITEEVKFHLENGKKSYGAGKLKDARGHFEAVLRLLYRAQNEPEFKEAQEQLEAMNGKEGRTQ